MGGGMLWQWEQEWALYAHIIATSPNGPTSRHGFNQILFPTDCGQRREREDGGEEGREGGASVPSASVHLACLLLNQTVWLVRVLRVLTPSCSSSSGTHMLDEFPVCLVEDLAAPLPGGAHWERRGVRRGGGGGEDDEEKHKREGQRGGWRGEGKGRDSGTLPSWDWFTSLTEITSLTYKPEVKISH